jgi:hypothetical protein
MVYVRGRMWRGIKNMCDNTQSAALLKRKKYKPFDAGQGVTLGCESSISPISLLY